MRDRLGKIGFFDDFVIGQVTDRVFGVKGTVKDNGISTDGRYVIIEYIADKEGNVVREVRISAKGATVYGYSIIDVEIGEDGGVYLLHKHGDEIWRTPIKLPTILIRGTLIEANDLYSKMDYNDIQSFTQLMKDEDFTYSIDLKAFNIRSSEDFTKTVAYAVNGLTQGDFEAKYGEEQYNAFIKLTNYISKSITDESFWEFGLNVQTDVEAGAEAKHGVDIEGITEDGTILKVDIEFAGSGRKCYNVQVSNLKQKFTEGKADLGIIFWEGEYHVFINSATEYEPLANIAKNIVSEGSRSIRDFAGVAIIGGLGLLSGYFSDTKGGPLSVTGDAGKWLGEFQDSYLDHTAVDGSTVLGSWLALTSVERSYLENVRSSGTTIAGSTLTNCNISAKMIYDSIVQNTLAVCSTITNCVIDLCRILNSTLVNVMGLDRSRIEDTSIANSVNISNCTIMGRNLMSVVNLSNTSITGSNLTLVVNVDNTKINHSDISYSANISRSEITNTKLVGCTIRGSKLTSCTATDSVLSNVNAINSNISGTSAVLSNLVDVNATNSKLTKASVEYSNLKDVVLKNTNVIGTDMKNTILVDKTIMYGRVVDSNENIIDPFRKVVTPNYSGKSSSSTSKSKTTSNTSSGKGSSTTYYIMPSSSSGKTSGSTQTKSPQLTTSQQTPTTTSQPMAEKPVSRGANVWIN